jgi:hypothetical protein
MLKKAILTAIFMAAAVGAPATDRSALDPVAVPAGPMKFSGSVLIVTRPETQWLFLTAQVWKGGEAASGGVMMLMGQRIPNELNWYHGLKTRTSIRSGDRITVTFQPPWAGLSLYTATLAAPIMISHTSPAHNAHVAVGGGGTLNISWSGGTPPYTVRIIEIDGGTSVFNRTGIGAGSVNVPLRTFTAGKRYQIGVQDANRRFSFDRTVDADSNLFLGQSSSVCFYAD